MLADKFGMVCIVSVHYDEKGGLVERARQCCLPLITS